MSGVYVMKDGVKNGLADLIQAGDFIKITPIDTMPNLIREFMVDYVTNDSLIYGVTEYCDGYQVPFWAIKKLEIIPKR